MQRLKGRTNFGKSLCYRHLQGGKGERLIALILVCVTGSQQFRFHAAWISLVRMISVAKIRFVSSVLFFLRKTPKIGKISDLCFLIFSETKASPEGPQRTEARTGAPSHLSPRIKTGETQSDCVSNSLSLSFQAIEIIW